MIFLIKGLYNLHDALVQGYPMISLVKEMYNLNGSYCCYSMILVIKGMYNIHDDLVLLFFDIID